MNPCFQNIINHLVGASDGTSPSGVSAAKLFHPGQSGERAIATNINAAFLILCCGPGHPMHEQARRYLEIMSQDRGHGATARFYFGGVDRVSRELSVAVRSAPALKRALYEAEAWCRQNHRLSPDGIDRLWNVFFPEGVGCINDPKKRIRDLRAARKIEITTPNPDPIKRPSRQVLFMSNLLITLPADPDQIDTRLCSAGICEQVRQAARTTQKYWYDHPIQIGTRPENNEAIYGLRGLNAAMRVEKERGGARADDKLVCILSVSVTHEGLQEVATRYLREVYSEIEPLPHLKVFIISEADTRRMVEEVLIPGAEQMLGISGESPFEDIFGVDGEYGRHYSFLKAFSAIWQVLIDPGVKASFKIDMDQVFDQTALIKETGRSALEHFITPLWGAEGVDTSGRAVDLGLMAGALVNEKDIENGLFTPDVTVPDGMPGGESLIFYSRLPQAISTHAEMMTRYDTPRLDGVKSCIHRIHVTGGTCAALIRSIRAYRPFTPSFIGRAEDQAFLLSTLFSDRGPSLRYLHKPGLIMRHDKESFAAEAVKGAKPGKYVGDLVRTILFSAYGRVLPWSVQEIKAVIDPFTGCFVSHIPLTVVSLRLAFHLCELWQYGDSADSEEALQIQRLAAGRLAPLMKEMGEGARFLKNRVMQEKAEWDLFYDLLNRMEAAIAEKDAFSLRLKHRAEALIKDCAVQVGPSD